MWSEMGQSLKGGHGPSHPVWGAKGSCATWPIRKCQRVLDQSRSSLWRFRKCKEQIVINKSQPWALALVHQIRNCGAGTVVLGFITRAFSAVALSDLSQRVAVDDLYLCELNWTIKQDNFAEFIPFCLQKCKMEYCIKMFIGTGHIWQICICFLLSGHS